MKRKIAMAVIALICIRSIAYAAYADAAQNLWEFLSDEGFDRSDENVRAHVYPISLTKQALGVALTLEGLLYDGEYFALGWRTENLQPETPALVLYTEVTVNGTPIQAVADHPKIHEAYENSDTEVDRRAMM